MRKENRNYLIMVNGKYVTCISSFHGYPTFYNLTSDPMKAVRFENESDADFAARIYYGAVTVRGYSIVTV